MNRPSLFTNNTPFIRKESIHIWTIKPLDLFPDSSTACQVLSEDEMYRAERFKFAHDRHFFVACRAFLRFLLGHYLEKHTSEVTFCYTEYGKPSLPNSGLYFNFSHSVDLAVLALSRIGELGVDLEYTAKKIDFMPIAAHFFAEKEYETLQQLPEKQRNLAFYLCWTRKEAFIKAVGEGLSFPLKKFEVSLIPDEPAEVIATHWEESERKHWSVFSFDPEPDYVGALASRFPHQEIKTFGSAEAYPLIRSWLPG